MVSHRADKITRTHLIPSTNQVQLAQNVLGDLLPGDGLFEKIIHVGSKQGGL